MIHSKLPTGKRWAIKNKAWYGNHEADFTKIIYRISYGRSHKFYLVSIIFDAASIKGWFLFEKVELTWTTKALSLL